MVDLSIIIVNYNSTADLQACLASISNNLRGESFEILVVDNYSKDRPALLQMMQRNFPEVKPILNSKNVGFAAANNIGMRKAKGRLMVLLNPDTVIIGTAVQKMAEFISSRNDIGMVGPLIVDESGEIQSYCGRSFPDILTEILHHSGIERIFPKSRFLGRYLMSFWDHMTTREVDLIQGSCMMIKSEALRKIGLMDERFFLFGDDVEYCFRFKKQGYKVFLFAPAKIVHKGGKSTSGKGGLSFIIGLSSMQIFFRIHYGSLTAVLYRISLVPLFLGKAVILCLRRHPFASLNMKYALWAIGLLKLERDNCGNPFIASSV